MCGHVQVLNNVVNKSSWHDNTGFRFLSRDLTGRDGAARRDGGGRTRRRPTQHAGMVAASGHGDGPGAGKAHRGPWDRRVYDTRWPLPSAITPALETV